MEPLNFVNGRVVVCLLKSNGCMQQMVELKAKVKYCSVCFNYTENDPCVFCSSKNRNHKQIIVVEQPNDVLAIEKTNEFSGLYHVLHGVLNPLDNLGPAELKIKELISRMVEVEEVILALNPSLEGEITTQYLLKILKTFKICLYQVKVVKHIIQTELCFKEIVVFCLTILLIQG